MNHGRGVRRVMSQAQRRAGGRGTDGRWAGQQGRPPARVGGCSTRVPAVARRGLENRLLGRMASTALPLCITRTQRVRVPVCLCIHVASGLFLSYSKYRMSPRLVFWRPVELRQAVLTALVALRLVRPAGRGCWSLPPGRRQGGAGPGESYGGGGGRQGSAG